MFNLVIGFINDVILVAGTAILAAGASSSPPAIPSKAVILGALLMGLVQAARRLDSKMAPPPLKQDAVRTPSQLNAQIRVTEAIDTIVERVTKALSAAQVSIPPPIASPIQPGKDSS